MNQKMIPESLYLALVKENELLKKEVTRLKSLVENNESKNCDSTKKDTTPPESCW
jgi:hypothetical protein